ncbi:ribonuclease P protein component [Candidatus Gracilibacteria bacterium]|nr:ribonuclease P protein component [Thermales bacterium]NJL97207.1 ribonuclease P protein component [Candidatus Gracilibacteria bacterium]NJS41473.1 ribonuclease P protein component [Candidatus Gracilibacteria bacterium]
MLPKKNRLVKEIDIQKAFRTKSQMHDNYFGLRLSKNNLNKFMLLVIVGKKIYKKANKRNLIRRRVHSIFEGLKAKNQLPLSINLIIQIKSKEVINLDYNDLKNNILTKTSKLYQKSLQESLPSRHKMPK